MARGARAARRRGGREVDPRPEGTKRDVRRARTVEQPERVATAAAAASAVGVERHAQAREDGRHPAETAVRRPRL